MYSVHALEVECISKGKAHKRYEFGCKVSMAATSKGGWFAGAMAVYSNPYDGIRCRMHWNKSNALPKSPSMFLLTWAIAATAVKVTPGSMWIKEKGPHGQKPLALDETKGGDRAWYRSSETRKSHGPQSPIGPEGDRLNAIFSAAGTNFAKLLKWLEDFLSLIFAWLLNCQRGLLMAELDQNGA